MLKHCKVCTTGAGVLIGILLCFDSPKLYAQATEEEVAAKIARDGGFVFRDEEGKVSGLTLTNRTFSPLRDEDIESIDFSVFSRLKSLSIDSKSLTDRAVAHLHNISPGLQRLKISNAQISDRELKVLLRKHKSSLGLISLIDTPITDRTLAEMGTLEKLQFLSLPGTRITDKGLKNLVKLSQLGVLDLGSTSVSDAGFAELIQLKHISILALANTKITDKGILQLAALENLQILDVTSTRVTENGKRALRALLPDLDFKDYTGLASLPLR